jgi:hypothetical protein
MLTLGTKTLQSTGKTGCGRIRIIGNNGIKKGLTMRTFAFLAILLTATSASAHKDRFETPRTLTVDFKTGERVAFSISDASVSAIALRIGTADFSVPEKECAKLRDIRFDTVSLVWNGSFASAAKADYFSLEFEMGKENARAFGELPRVRLMFRDGKFTGSAVTKKIGQDSWQDFKL